MSVEFVLRLIGMVVFSVLGWLLGVFLGGETGAPTVRYIIILSLAGAALGLLITPYLTVRPFSSLRRSIRQMPASQLLSAIIGLILGLIVAALLALPLSLLPSPFGQILPFAGAIIFAYMGVAVMLMRHHDLLNALGSRLSPREGGREIGREDNVILLDTSVIIDGRIADVSQTGFITGTLLVPRFVLNELQHIADSSEPLRRARGRRGLDMLNRLQKGSIVPIRITDLDVEEVHEVDDKLIALAKQLHCPIITNDFNLNRVAELQGVAVLNINELANAVKAVFLPGESMKVRIIQEGKEVGQGVGYLDDGTMVVVENGRRYINNTIEVTVTKVLQTAAGRMIFATPNGKSQAI
jgi:uncharacterized protein YacL